MPGRTKSILSLCAVGVLLCAAPLAQLACRARPQPDRRPDERLLKDQGGPIEHVVCVVNTARKAALRNANVVTRIVNALPPRVKLTILTNDRSALIVARNPHPGRVDFLELPEDSAFTIWPQDPFLVLSGQNDKTILLAGRQFARADDRLIAAKLAEHLDWELRQSDLSFEGGNIVCNARHAFVGADTITDNALRTGLEAEEIVRRFQHELGRRVLVLGPSPQPVGHIDMAVTPLGGNRIAVADTAWGARLARGDMQDAPAKVKAFETACQTQYFGLPDIKTLLDIQGKAIVPPKVVGQTAEAVETSEAIAVHLDGIAKGLTDQGYQVHRMPMLLWLGPPAEAPTSQSASAPASGPADPKPGYPCLTYNNVLLETADDGPVVYLPQYGWRSLDSAAGKAWETLGYAVRPVKGLTVSAMYGGSLRCCTKVLRRGSEAP